MLRTAFRTKNLLSEHGSVETACKKWQGCADMHIFAIWVILLESAFLSY